MEYNMEDFLRSCVARYQELTGVARMRIASTPFLPEPTTPDFSDDLPVTAEEIKQAERNIRKGAEMQPYAAKVLMKVLYAARYARLDLLRAVCHLAQFITKWDADCDARLYRLMCYIHSTYHYRLTGWVGNTLDEVDVHLFADADFAGDSKSSKSTSGIALVLLGSRTAFPLAGQSKKQTCVSHSTPEAEVVAADHGMRTYGLPGMDLWDKLLDRAIVLQFHEDNETAIGAMKHGASPTMRHLKRTHGVCLRWLAERFKHDCYELFYERSALQAADIYTKAFTVPAEWDKATRLINILDPDRFWHDDRGGTAGDRLHMGTVHKGGVEFSYQENNPWHGRESKDIPKLSAEAAGCVAAPPKDIQMVESHVCWAALAKAHSVTGIGKTVADDTQDDGNLSLFAHVEDYLKEQPDIDEDDYASTAAPDSDDEMLEYAEDAGGDNESSSKPSGCGVMHNTAGSPKVNTAEDRNGSKTNESNGKDAIKKSKANLNTKIAIDKSDCERISKMISEIQWPQQARKHVSGKSGHRKGLGTCVGMTYEKSQARLGHFTQQQSKLVRYLNEVLDKHLMDLSGPQSRLTSTRCLPGTEIATTPGRPSCLCSATSRMEHSIQLIPGVRTLARMRLSYSMVLRSIGQTTSWGTRAFR